jgi:hypothetical protein
LTAGLLTGLAACGPSAQAGKADAREATGVDTAIATQLATVRQGRIFFAHHSVGVNLIEGLGRIDAEVGHGAVKLVNLDKTEPVEGPALMNGTGGQNGEPQTKIDYFAATIRDRHGLKPQLAFMKFCFVDFDPSTDVDRLFDRYRSTMETLKGEHPEIRFAHVTVPLMRRPTELKWRIYRLLGREIWEEAANVKRRLFNEKILRTFAADPVFDLARAESTRPDGTREAYQYRGAPFFSLYPDYTQDGGHLNAYGQRVAAQEMIRFMAAALKTPTAPPPG